MSGTVTLSNNLAATPEPVAVENAGATLRRGVDQTELEVREGAAVHGHELCTHCWDVFSSDIGAICPSCDALRPDEGWATMPYIFDGKYRFIRLLGRGAMGAVFLAREVDSHGESAGEVLGVKVVQHIGGEAYATRLRQMFGHEAAVAALLGRSANFVQVYAHALGRNPFLVMEYMPWPTLKSVFQTQAPIPVPSMVALGLALLEATEVMHFHRIIHRDLKPANLFVRESDDGWQIKVADMGVWTHDHEASAKEQAENERGVFIGTLSYASPEQMAGAPVGVRSDLHAVGSILYEAVVGAPPYPGGRTGDARERLHARIAAAKERPPWDDRLPMPVYEFLAQALAQRPEDRFENARKMANALRALIGLGGHPEVSGRPALPIAPSGGPSRSTIIEGPTDLVVAAALAPVGAAFSARYEIEALLGAGGMATVHRAWQVPLARPVALKKVNRAMMKGFTREAQRALFIAQARGAALLSHPHTVRIYDQGIDDEGMPFVAMELVAGRTLDQVLGADGAMSERRVAALGARIAGSLTEAHARGVMHGNLKASTVYLVDIPGLGEMVKVAKYGLHTEDAHLVPQGMILGTPKSMAPEQVRGETPGPAADLYALATLLFELATGSHPFPYASVNALLVAKLKGEALPMPGSGSGGPISDAFRAVIDVLLIPSLDTRPADAQTVANWLHAIAAGQLDNVPTRQLQALHRSR